MASHKVPGFSIVLIDQGELAWAKGYDVLEAGGDQVVTTLGDNLLAAAVNGRRWLRRAADLERNTDDGRLATVTAAAAIA